MMSDSFHDAATSSRVATSIVVGVDGSAGSLAALRWALHEAELRQAGLQAVFVWQYHPAWTDPGLGSMFPVGYRELRPAFDPSGARMREAQSAAEKSLETVINSVVLSAETVRADPPVPVTQQAVQGHPAAVLLDLAADADLLVVGSRGHGTFTAALLGSISQHVVTHARCPVVVVPGEHRHERAHHAHTHE